MGTHRAGPPAERGDAVGEPRPTRAPVSRVRSVPSALAAPPVKHAAPPVKHAAPAVKHAAPAAEIPAPPVKHAAPLAENPAPPVKHAAPLAENPAAPVEDPEPQVEDPAPAAASGGRRGRADRKAERLAKAERAVAEYARKDAERAARKAARRPAEAGARPSAHPVPALSGEPVRDAAPAAAGSADGWFQDTGDNPGVAATAAPHARPTKAGARERPAKAARAAKQPREPRPKDPRRRRRQAFITTFSALGLAAAIGGGLAVANFAEGAGGEGTAAPPVLTMSATALQQLTSVPAAVLDDVGAGSAVALLGRVEAPPLRSGKKPRLLYIGSESCPLCAAERWPLIVALSRFGTWSGLGVILSPKDEVFPNTPTFTFHGATYTSKYLVFSAFETTSRVRTGGVYAPLDVLSPADAETLRTVRVAPNVPEEATSRLPFLNLAGKFVGAGTHVRAAFMPYFADKTHDQIAAALADPTSALATSIDGGANALTAAICEVIPKKTRPTEVCSSAAVKLAKSILRAKR